VKQIFYTKLLFVLALGAARVLSETVSIVAARPYDKLNGTAPHRHALWPQCLVNEDGDHFQHVRRHCYVVDEWTGGSSLMYPITSFRLVSSMRCVHNSMRLLLTDALRFRSFHILLEQYRIRMGWVSRKNRNELLTSMLFLAMSVLIVLFSKSGCENWMKAEKCRRWIVGQLQSSSSLLVHVYIVRRRTHKKRAKIQIRPSKRPPIIIEVSSPYVVCIRVLVLRRLAYALILLFFFRLRLHLFCCCSFLIVSRQPWLLVLI